MNTQNHKHSMHECQANAMQKSGNIRYCIPDHKLKQEKIALHKMIKKFHAYLVNLKVIHRKCCSYIFVNNKIAHYNILSLVFFTIITSKQIQLNLALHFNV